MAVNLVSESDQVSAVAYIAGYLLGIPVVLGL